MGTPSVQWEREDLDLLGLLPIFSAPAFPQPNLSGELLFQFSQLPQEQGVSWAPFGWDSKVLLTPPSFLL